MDEYHQKLQVRGSFSIIRIKEYDRLDKGVLSRMEEQKTFRNRPHVQAWVRMKWWLVWYRDLKAQGWGHDNLGSCAGGEHWQRTT